MGKYIIAIGGTGIKCLESFLHVSAIGGFGDSNETYYALIVEGDRANGNKNRLQSQIANYTVCQKVFYPYGVDKQETFSRQEQRRLKEQNERGLFKDTFVVNKKDGKDAFFVWEPDHNKGSLNKMAEDMNADTRGLLEVLFTKEELKTDLEVGFKGHPNIGSLTIDHLMDLTDDESVWYDFLGLGNSELREGNTNMDIMIVGSVFGGTGAAGLYAIANKIRNFKYEDRNTNIDCQKLIKDKIMNIGICMMLPYYILPSPDKDEALAATNIMENTVHALDYYAKQDNFLKDISVMMIGKSNQEVLIEDEERHINQYATGDAEQENKSMTPELIAAYAFDNFFKKPQRKGSLTYTLRQREIKDPDDESEYAVNWESMPVSDKFQQRLRNMMVFALAYTAKLYPVIEKHNSDTASYHWLGKCINDMDAVRREQAASIDAYCRAFIYWAMDVCAAGERSKDTYRLIDHKKVDMLRQVDHDDDVDYGNIVFGIKREKNWNRIWEGINGSGKVFEQDKRRIGLHRLVTDVYDNIK